MESSCCAWRSHSALLYLNDGGGADYEGGEFIFKNEYPWQKDQACYGEDLIITPQCGTMVSFTSGGENVHGVNRLKSGIRYALAIWFTKDTKRIERVFEKELPCIGKSCGGHDEL